MKNISTLVNARNISNLDFVSVSCIQIADPKYLKIEDWKVMDRPFKLKFFNPETSLLKPGHAQRYFFDCLILSYNLLLKEAVLSKRGLMPELPSEGPAPKPEIEYTEHGVKISSTDVDTVFEDSRIISGRIDMLCENEILELLQKILSLKKINSETDLIANNLNKSLNMYEESMSSSNRVIIFRDLYSSLELAAYCERSSICGEMPKEKMARVSEMNIHTVKALGEFYNRTKHVDRNLEDIKLYREGLKSIGPKITCLRQGAQNAIISQLRKI